MIVRENPDGTLTPISIDEMEEEILHGDCRTFLLSNDMTDEDALELVRASTKRLSERKNA